MVRLLADVAIPYLDEMVSSWAKVTRFGDGRPTYDQLLSADALLVRSVTPVSANLLKASPIRFVGSVTAGVDHIDCAYLAQAGIAFAHSPGANANAVAEYVASIWAVMQARGQLHAGDQVAVIGVGQVGRRVVALGEQLGLQMLSYDPPRAEREAGFDTISWERCRQVQHICVCCPLTCDCSWPTRRLLAEDTLSGSACRWLINVGRGGVLDEAWFLAQDEIGLYADVWQDEPDINLAVVRQAALATPHIAGYSRAAKRALTQQAVTAMHGFFTQQMPLVAASTARRIALPEVWTSQPYKHILSHFDPRGPDKVFRASITPVQQAVVATVFRQCRLGVSLRDSWPE